MSHHDVLAKISWKERDSEKQATATQKLDLSSYRKQHFRVAIYNRGETITRKDQTRL